MPRYARIAFSLLALPMLSLLGCGPSTTTPDAHQDAHTDGMTEAATDAGPICRTDIDCTDSVFCNGVERCMPGATGADAHGCLPANPSNPCLATQHCNESMARCETVCDTSPDADRDGHRAISCGGDDCDDTDPLRFPTNVEVCDFIGHDEDCDPCTVASPAPTGGSSDGDRDHDAYISDHCRNSFLGAAPTCDAIQTRIDSALSMITGSDCNDNNPNQHPSQVEICNGIDDNCNGMIDESGTSTFYADVDGDGRGNPLAPTSSTLCVPPAGFSATGDDCNDNDPNVYAGAPELCDGIDDNCSLPPGRAGGPDSSEDQDGDHFSPATATCVGGPFPTTDCNDTLASVHPGAPEICDALDNDCDGTPDEPTLADADCRTLSPHMNSVCRTGACAPGACAVGFGDCDGVASNGCEVDLGSTATSCGACGARCGGGGTCNGGRCDAIVQIDGGDSHLCALNSSGTIGCFGTNSSGQLGNGTHIDSASPVTVTGLTTATQIASGVLSTCALRADGTVVCWGDNSSGELGDNTTVSRTVPVPVMGLTGVTQIAAGNFHYCAVRNDHTVWCWGGNFLGALGDGTTTERHAPVQVPGVTDATQVAARGRHSCAIRAGGSVWCWGANDYGQIGIAGTWMSSTAIPTPTRIGTITGALQLTSGQQHVCARLSGSVQCWGDPAFAEVGVLDTVNTHPAPFTIPGLIDAATIYANGAFTCALRTNGSVLCWGLQSGLGDGLPTHTSCRFGSSCTAAPVYSRNITGATVIGGGTTQACAVTGTGQIACWGGGAPGLVNDPVNIAGISSGLDFTCVWTGGGTASCWGQNLHGQLGDGTTTAHSVPAPVQNVDHVVQLAAGQYFGCARRFDGTVLCWGRNNDAQLGNGTITPTATTATTPVVGLTDAIDLSSNGFFSSSDDVGRACAVRATGQVVCWGGNDFNALGDGSGTHMTCMHGSGSRAYTTDCSPTPVTVTGITNAIRVAVGTYHVCALLADHTVWCWGDGPLGDGTNLPSDSPTMVMGVANAVQIVAEGTSTCARTAAGGVLCWGANGTGSIGDGTTTDRLTAVPVSGISSGAVSIAGAPGFLTGDYYCASFGASGARCWGTNTRSQLGDATTVSRSTPVPVMGLATSFSIGAQLASACALTGTTSLSCWGGGLAVPAAPFVYF